MDQVKVVLAVVKKYHFWILSVLVLIVGAAVWFMASDTLATSFKTNLTKIEGADKSLASAVGDNPPNATFKEKVDKLHDGLKLEVADVWKGLYEKQVDLFVWPDLVADTIAKLGPGEPIPERIRAYYNDNVVRDEWKRVFDLAKIRRPAGIDEDLAGGGGGGGGAMGGPMLMNGVPGDAGGGAQEVEMEGIVWWDRNLRADIISRYYSEKSPPSDLKLRLTQEDLWIFENSLVDVVQQVNANAHDSLGATIKQIQALDLAQWAINAANESDGALWRPGQQNGAGGMPGMGGGMPGMGGGMPGMGGGPAGGGPAGGMPGMGGGPAGGMPGMGGEAGKEPGAGGGPGPAGGGPGPAGEGAAAAGGAGDGDAALLNGRYLDDQGKPMNGDGTGPYAEFKQMFVYMRFVMDQRKLPDLMAACANARLPIETRQVRVHLGDPDKAAAGNGGGGMGMMPGGGGDMGLGMGQMMGGGGGAGNSQVETGPYDVTVELSGIIYLYNLPDIAKLGTGSSADPSKRSFSVPKGKVAAPGKQGGGGGMMSMPGMPGAN